MRTRCLEQRGTWTVTVAVGTALALCATAQAQSLKAKKPVDETAAAAALRMGPVGQEVWRTIPGASAKTSTGPSGRDGMENRPSAPTSCPPHPALGPAAERSAKSSSGRRFGRRERLAKNRVLTTLQGRHTEGE